ncbi:MAG: serine--tRNA ligase [Campylobacterales bacterium]
MIDLKLLEQDLETFLSRLKGRGTSPEILETLKNQAQSAKALRRTLEEKQALQNKLSKEFGQIKAQGGDVAALQAQVSANKAAIGADQEALRIAESALEALALSIPNLPDQDVPVGKDENDNVELKRVLTPRVFEFEPKPHYELGTQQGWLDFERGAKISGSRFTVMRGLAARLERALIAYMLDFNRSRGFEEVWVPVLINRKSLTATGQLPKFEEDLYLAENAEMTENDLFLAPTAEVPLVNLYRDEILPLEALPVKLTAYTSCFRKEAGSAGRDTRGMIRQHQFDKVELVALSVPEESDRLFEEMVACASDLLTSLELPHRLLQLCTGDMGFSAARTIDLEVWIPSESRYREISSVSNTRDFQPRRAKIRYKSDKGNKLVHALNGSSLAVGRTLIALMENNQQADGTIRVPAVLEPYLK